MSMCFLPLIAIPAPTIQALMVSLRSRSSVVLSSPNVSDDHLSNLYRQHGYGSTVDALHGEADDLCGSPQSKTHQEQCILKSSLTSGSNLSVALNGQTHGTSS